MPTVIVGRPWGDWVLRALALKKNIGAPTRGCPGVCAIADCLSGFNFGASAASAGAVLRH
ncbi:hypothetical protein [Kamptonema formosum]|uniref:hypothetical protein n=1 Tax=Kamptonema formosum TaxID=331992 RepID=UPI000477A4B8|nr:hypothetical protein [Oscillatoria sp. PCC 10802]